MTEHHRPAYIALVAALRAEFLPTSLEALWIQMRGHRYNTTSLGVLAQAVHDARDLTYDTGDDLRTELEKVRAELADVRNQAHRDHTEHQQALRDKNALANERDALKAERDAFRDSALLYAAQTSDLTNQLRSVRATCDAYKDQPPPIFQGPGLSERGEGYNAGTRDMARAVLDTMAGESTEAVAR